MNAEFSKRFDIRHVKEILARAPGVVLQDDPSDNVYPMPINANGRNEVFVGRVRADTSRKNTLNMFSVSDNVRKGAATNAVQILQLCLGKRD